ncbi:unnamed protein product [Linum trigynum]|uniref:Uncharacterized protein n=1 Tax=Linum trigynum TaxID=586398 RepID=A0AAV2G929_9ROSI
MKLKKWKLSQINWKRYGASNPYFVNGVAASILSIFPVLGPPSNSGFVVGNWTKPTLVQHRPDMLGMAEVRASSERHSDLQEADVGLDRVGEWLVTSW